MNLAEILVVLLFAAAFAAAVRHVLKHGACSACGECSACAACAKRGKGGRSSCRGCARGACSVRALDGGNGPK